MRLVRGTVSIQVVEGGKWYDWKYGTRHPDFKKARSFALECYKRDMKGSKE